MTNAAEMTQVAPAATLGVAEDAPEPALPAVVAERAPEGEPWVTRLLRAGALASGGLFLASLGLELLPTSALVQQVGESLRQAAASVLLATPVLRLVGAGAVMGRRGEWRYALCAAGVLLLLGVAVALGLRD